MPVDIVYTPTSQKVTSNTDATVYFAAQGISANPNNPVRNQGGGNLAELGPDGGTLFVVGHGNAGGKIGAHGHEAVGARSLVKQLEQEGLPKSPKAQVAIHLYACASGSSVRTAYALWRKAPYAERFAAALAKAGFNNYHVVGYVGFMGMDGEYSLSYHYQDSSKRNFQGKNRIGAPTITFYVNAGGHAKINGDKWQQSTEWRIHPGPKRKNSYVLNIKKA
jgi:hypothetical protein